MAGFTEFVCRAGGSNTYAGTLLGDSTEPGTTPFKTYTAGAWVNATRTFTPVSGVPSTDLTVGMYVNVGGTYGGRISTVGATTFVVDGTSNWGTNPANGTYDANIGGAWLGPSGADGFPFTKDLGNARNVAGNQVYINFKSDQPLVPSSGWTAASQSNAPRWGGYTTTFRDGGLTSFGLTTGASFTLLTTQGTGSGMFFEGFDCIGNGATGNATGFSFANANLSRCAFRNMKGAGFTHNGSEGYFDNLQIDNNGGAGASLGSDNYRFTNCTVTRNGANGINASGGNIYAYDTTAASNTGVGMAGAIVRHIGGDCYANTTYGYTFSNRSLIQNVSIVKNTTGVANCTNGTPANIVLVVRNCSLGVGTQANGAGFPTNVTLEEHGTINLATGVTPWNAPTTGDFTNVLASTQGTGYGYFPNQASGYGGTLSFPNVTASQQLVTVSVDPGIANVRTPTAYTINGVALVGTCAVPTAANVRLGTAVDATTGTCVVPAAADVKSGVSVDNTTGTLLSTNPGAANVLAPTPYSINSVSFIGTLVATTPAPTVSSLGRMGIGL